jgi:oligoribonuclease
MTPYPHVDRPSIVARAQYPALGGTRVTDRLVWIDCEMTGLDLVHDALVEVAAIVTDADLNVLDEGIDVLIAPPQAALDQMDEFVVQMHTDSGLLEALAGPETVSLEEAERRVLAYVAGHVPEPRKAPLCGSSVYTDRGFLARDMPALEAHLHYRLVDVSSFKELARRWYPRVYFNAPVKQGGHRALADIRDSIEELRFYRAALFVPAPGPDTATARAIAAQYGMPAPAEG